MMGYGKVNSNNLITRFTFQCCFYFKMSLECALVGGTCEVIFSMLRALTHNYQYRLQCLSDSKNAIKT